MASTTTSTTTIKPKRYIWTPVKDSVLEILGDLYCATPYDIARYRHRHEPTPHDLRSTNATLQDIHAFDPHKKYWKRAEFGRKGYIYGLTDYGAKYVNNLFGAPARELESRDHEHEHLITEIHIRLREFCYKHSFGFEWTQAPVNHKNLINPDAIVKIKTSTRTFVFSLEPERQSYGENHLKKAMKYHSIFGTPDCKKQFGEEKIRVVFITMTDRKRTTMLEKLSEEYPYRMFWFTSTAHLDNMDGKIFKTPKDHTTESYSLLDVLR